MNVHLPALLETTLMVIASSYVWTRFSFHIVYCVAAFNVPWSCQMPEFLYNFTEVTYDYCVAKHCWEKKLLRLKRGSSDWWRMLYFCVTMAKSYFSAAIANTIECCFCIHRTLQRCWVDTSPLCSVLSTQMPTWSAASSRERRVTDAGPASRTFIIWRGRTRRLWRYLSITWKLFCEPSGRHCNTATCLMSMR